MNDLPEAHDRLIDAEREVRRLEDDNRRLLSIVRTVEWDSYGRCPICGKSKPGGHAARCPVKAALG